MILALYKRLKEITIAEFGDVVIGAEVVWEQGKRRDFVYRHDNAPHKAWRKVSTFPKHCHEGTQSQVTESHISDEPEEAIRWFLHEVRRLLLRFTSEEQSRRP